MGWAVRGCGPTTGHPFIRGTFREYLALRPMLQTTETTPGPVLTGWGRQALVTAQMTKPHDTMQLLPGLQRGVWSGHTSWGHLA